MDLSVSFRTRILLIVLILGTVPPLLVGLWLTRSGARTSEALVVSQVEEVLEETAPMVVSRWISLRSRLLDLADSPVVQGALHGPRPDSMSPATVEGTPAGNLFGVVAVRLQSEEGEGDLAGLGPFPEAPPLGTGPTIQSEFPVYARAGGQRLGTLVAEIDPRALLPESALLPSGGVLGLFDAADGSSLLPRAFDRPLLVDDHFSWGGDEWIARRFTMDEPGITLAVAAPLTPFTRPFEETAGKAGLLLLGVAILGFVVAVMATRRMTGSMRELADAAEAVAGGELERSISVKGRDEIARASRAFNTMTESLRNTLAELSTRESLAAMGEFAATLAHEVRNPLTAIRIDLERVEEGLPEDSDLRAPQERAIYEVGRLEETVSDALAGVRGGLKPGLFDLGVPLRNAADSAAPAFQESGGRLELPEFRESLEIQGDSAALEQLFLNLFRNAAQAMNPGGTASVSLELSGSEVAVEVLDDGEGIPDQATGRVFEPLFTTRPEGTGLGLTIARRIAEAHGGTLDLSNRPGGGVVARVVLPIRGRTRV